MAAAEAAPLPFSLKPLAPPAPPAPESVLGQALVNLTTVTSEEAARAAASELNQILKAEGIEALHKVRTRFFRRARSPKRKNHARHNTQAMPVIVAAQGSSFVEQAALLTVTSLAESMGQAAEPFLVTALDLTLNRAAAKDANVRQAAEEAAHALMALLCPALSYVLPVRERA
jgi:hypothetical protein